MASSQQKRKQERNRGAVASMLRRRRSSRGCSRPGLNALASQLIMPMSWLNNFGRIGVRICC